MTQVASNVDISPTILDLAGVKPRYELDGKSMVNECTVHASCY